MVQCGTTVAPCLESRIGSSPGSRGDVEVEVDEWNDRMLDRWRITKGDNLAYVAPPSLAPRVPRSQIILHAPRSRHTAWPYHSTTAQNRTSLRSRSDETCFLRLQVMVPKWLSTLSNPRGGVPRLNIPIDLSLSIAVLTPPSNSIFRSWSYPWPGVQDRAYHAQDRSIHSGQLGSFVTYPHPSCLLQSLRNPFLLSCIGGDTASFFASLKSKAGSCFGS